MACAWASRLPSDAGDVIASVFVVVRGELATIEGIGFRKECVSGSTSSNSNPLKVDSISDRAGGANSTITLHFMTTTSFFIPAGTSVCRRDHFPKEICGLIKLPGPVPVCVIKV